jgi:hypothetical protein
MQQMLHHGGSLSCLLAAFLSLCASLAFVALALAQPPAEDKKYPHDVHFDFRGKPLPPELTLTPNGSEQFVKSEPEGLRITLPKDRADLAPVELRTRFMLKGDFEITAALEILQAEKPKGGFGVGASIFVNKLEPRAEGATFGWLLRSGGKELIFWDRGFVKKGEAPQYDIDYRPCTDKSLRLRLKRTGAQLSYLLGIGLIGDQFEELPPKTFGPNDIERALVRITTGRQRASVDVRLIDLRIRSGAVPAAPIPVVEPPPVQPSRSWLLAALCVALALTLPVTIIFALLLFRRRRIGADQTDK